MLHVIDYKKYDVLNGPGIRCSIWLSGCSNKCKGCWAVNTWNATAGKTFKENKETIFQYIANPKNDGVSLLGGDPLFHFFNDNLEEQNEVLEILKYCKELGKNVWVWTGYNFEEIKEKHPELLEYIDILVDGKFNIDKKDMKLFFRGSSNQRIIDVRSSIIANEIITKDYK